MILGEPTTVGRRILSKELTDTDMFCPQCGSTQPDELNFCKSCGAHLQGVRTALEGRETSEKFNWNKTWLADMLMSGEAKVHRAAEIDRLSGRRAEIKRRNEIKAGTITASVGVGLSIATFVIMEGIIASGSVSAAAIAILSRVWIAGLIPVLIGLALIFNGLVVSKKKDVAETLEGDTSGDDMDRGSDPEYLSPTETNQLRTGNFSVTEDTTRHLGGPRRDDSEVGVKDQ